MNPSSESEGLEVMVGLKTFATSSNTHFHGKSHWLSLGVSFELSCIFTDFHSIPHALSRTFTHYHALSRTFSLSRWLSRWLSRSFARSRWLSRWITVNFPMIFANLSYLSYFWQIRTAITWPWLRGLYFQKRDSLTPSRIIILRSPYQLVKQVRAPCQMDSVIEPRIGTVIGNSLYIHPISYTDAGRLCASSISWYISVITGGLSVRHEEDKEG